MSNLIHHPEDGLLLRYIDGELPSRKVRQVSHHLEACWQCRSEVEQLQITVADCVRYRKSVLQAHLPPPPNPWPDIYREFARADAALREEPWLARIQRTLASPLVFRWGVAVTAALVIAVAVFQQLRETPTVEAAVLLKRAVSAAGRHPGAARRILVQTRTQRMTRLSGSHRVSHAAEPLAADLQARFQAAHYDWDDPLSAKSYQAWFDGVSNKHDEVTTVADPQWPAERCYQIRTVTADGTVAAASLMLRTADLSPVESKLEFRDREWVEFSEIADATPVDGGLPVTTNIEPPVGHAETGKLAPPSPESGASIFEELEVLGALHDIGADLGDPIEVALSGGQVVVTGVGLPPERQKQIHDALAALPHVDVRFSEPGAASLPAVPVVPENVSGASKPTGLQARVEQQVGGRVEFERFSAQVLDRNEAMMSRAYALRALAQRFPAEKEVSLTLRERQLLRDMARENAEALSKEAAAMERALNPLLAAMGGSAAANVAPAQSAWEPAAEQLFQASHRVEVLVSVMLGAAKGDGVTDHWPSDLLSAIRGLRADLTQCRELLSK